MGVSGCGKTTVGRMLAETLDVEFLDADDFHPTSNIEKMRSGIPLTDADRWPWLKILANELSARPAGCVLACSALKQAYRDILDQTSVDIIWVYLEASPALIEERLRQRKGHFMPSALIASQFEALEPPENAIVVDAGKPVEEILQDVGRRT